jgi:hypothetical protein
MEASRFARLHDRPFKRPSIERLYYGSATNSPSELRRIEFSCVAMAALAQSAVFHRIIRSNLAQRENVVKKTRLSTGARLVERSVVARDNGS